MSNEAKGVSSCYVFKSRLQEYAQKVGFCTPAYETIKEGPSHEPFFRSTVIVNNARYDSLAGFSNRKAAEQSAAEVALIELAKCNDKKDCISQPVHELGLCKNLLQEYAQKMNYAMPIYECKRADTAGRGGHYSCSVEIGGIRYIGAVARTKKEAEIKAARTSLLAIQTSSSEMEDNLNEETNFTVIPPKRKEPSPKKVVVKTRKTKRPRMKNKFSNKKRKLGEDNAIQAESCGAVNNDVPSENGSLDVPVSLNMNQSHGDTSASEGLLKSNGIMSDCQPISVSDTSQDGTSSVNNNHGGAISGHQFKEGKETQPVSMEEMKPWDGTPTRNEDNAIQAESSGALNNDLPSENGSLDVPALLNMNQSHGDTSASEGLLKSNGKMSDCQPISVSDTTSQDGTSYVNNTHGGAISGHQFKECNETQPVSMEEINPRDGTPTTNPSHGEAAPQKAC